MEKFHSYSVEIVDKAFVIGEVKRSEKTAIVQLFDFHGNRIDIRDYAYVDKKELYKAIAQKDVIDLNNCYVKNFSLTEFRSENDLAINAVVQFGEFSAINAFIDSDHSIDFSYGFFTGDSLHFINSIFSSHDLNFMHCKFESIVEDFSEVTFHCKNINFQYADFHEGEVLFKDTLFQSETISFVNCNFYQGKQNFSGADFTNANLAFQFAKFGEGDLSFEKTRFMGSKIDFSKVEFGSGRVDFRLSEFGNGDLLFDECEMSQGKIRFRRAKFGSGRISFEQSFLGSTEISFERTEFGNGELSFYRAEIDSILFHSSHLNNYVDLRVNKCNLIDLSSSIVRDIVDLTNEQGRVQIKEMNFSGMRNLGRLFLDYFDNDVKRLIYSQKDTTVKQKADQFRMLKEEFRALGQYLDEDKSYLEFKRLELKERKRRALSQNKMNALWFYPIYWGEYLIFDQIGHYATNPMRVLVSMILSFIFITFLYVVLILTTSADIVSSVGDPDKLPLLTKSIYHSAITFLTIGYGDYYPSGFIRWLSGIEGFVGLFLMSYFTVAFVRKVLR